MADRLEESIPDDSPDVVDYRAAASRVPGGLKGVRQLAEVFIVECESIMDAIRAEIPDGDPATVHRNAHTLKGSANLFFAKRVREAAQRIETRSREKGIEDLQADFQKLQDEVEVLLQSLRRFLEVTAES
jgi:HPt (histidine-containing phosphotransfer) domain-containing protein